MKKFILFSVFCLLILGGCSKDTTPKETSANGITQYYKEHEISFPKGTDQARAVWQEDGDIKALLSADGPLAEYTWDAKKECFQKSSDLSFPDDLDAIFRVYPLQDGRYLLQYQDEKVQIHYALLEQGKVTKVLEEIAAVDGIVSCAIPADNGFLVGTDMVVKLVSYDGEILESYDCQVQPSSLSLVGDTLYVFGVDSIQAFSFSEGQKLEFSNQALEEFLTDDWYTAFWYDETGEEVYKLDSSGVHSFSLKDGSQKHLLKKHMDMGYLSALDVQVCFADDHTIYLFTTEYGMKSEGIRFEYVEEGYVSDTEELTLYSLNKDAIPHMLLVGFEEENPQYYVEPVYSLDTLEEDSTDVMEQAFAEVSERLSSKKNAPDLLFCDLLPVDTYIDAELLKPLDAYLPKNSADWFFNVLRAFSREKQVYAFPVNFSIPLITGKAEYTGEDLDLETIVNKLSAQTEEIGSLFAHVNSRSLWNALYSAYIPECFLEDGVLDRQKMEEFFTSADAILGSQDTQTEEISLYRDPLSSLWVPYSVQFISQLVDVLVYDAPVTFSLFSEGETIPLIKGLEDDFGYYSDIASYFVPTNIFAVPKHGSNEKGVETFLNYVLEHAQTYFSGLPVSLQQLKTSMEFYENIGASAYPATLESGEDVRIPYGKMTEEEISGWFQKFVITQYGGHEDALTRLIIRQAFDEYRNQTHSLADAVNAAAKKLEDAKAKGLL